VSLSRALDSVGKEMTLILSIIVPEYTAFHWHMSLPLIQITNTMGFLVRTRIIYVLLDTGTLYI